MRRKEKEALSILYFINDSAPTTEDEDAADAIEALDRRFSVKFRNGQAAKNDTLEVCNGVAGPAIPPAYSAKYPTVTADGSMTINADDMNSDASVRPVQPAISAEMGAPVQQQPISADLFGGFKSG